MLPPFFLATVFPDDDPTHDVEPNEETSPTEPDPVALPSTSNDDEPLIGTSGPIDTDPADEGWDEYARLEDLSPEVGPVPRSHPAYDRVQTRDEDRQGASMLLRGAGILLLVIVALAVTYLMLRPEASDGEVPDLLALAAAHADVVELEVVTDDLDLAQDYILSEFGWPVRVPVLPDARLLGVGAHEIADGIELPVVQYTSEEGGPITVFMYDYAFLDAATGRLRLMPAVYSRLADDNPVDVRRVGETSLVLWRRRAAIYTAVLDDDPAHLVEFLRRRS